MGKLMSDEVEFHFAHHAELRIMLNGDRSLRNLRIIQSKTNDTMMFPPSNESINSQI